MFVRGCRAFRLRGVLPDERDVHRVVTDILIGCSLPAGNIDRH